ncbi:hypothetical protein INS49_014482 [Diaporthe citri]|uniref:uncharacterized protein n=1 Tax=Diaporthe citri TaxID=83186 RepID=UPI001C7EABE5|nr:uncharacterized protein INS49_014482 [Diaporthe citri]KAG6356609.1 hypothetical protein INS49_014482 [Diaporthe citri]
MAALKLFRRSPGNHNHHHRLAPARRNSSPLFYTLTEPSLTAHVGPEASTPTGQPEDIGQDNQTTGLSAGTIVTIIFSGLILIFLLTVAYACASSHHKSRRDRRSTLGRRSHYYQDDADGGDNDTEMQAQRHTRQTLLGRLDEDQSTDQRQYNSYHHEGAGMGYDDEDGKEAWIEVGTARVAHFRRVPTGTVSIRNIGRGKAPAPLGSSQSVRDVVSLPDLAWAETLTTGGGRRPDAVVSAPAAAVPPAPATRTSSKSSGSERSKKLQERSESRRAVKRKAIREWCARGSGGGLGPYSAAY